MNAVIKSKITELAGRAALGKWSPRQKASAPEVDRPPNADEVAAARIILKSYASRLRELAECRSEFDRAVSTERQFERVDLASLVEVGDELPDLAAAASSRARSRTRLLGLRGLLDRDCEKAAAAVHSVRRAKMHEAVGAIKAARAEIEVKLEGLFALDDHENVISLSTPMRALAIKLQEAQNLPRIPLVTAPLFGCRLPEFRIDALPDHPAAITPPDGLDPSEVAAGIEAVLTFE